MKKIMIVLALCTFVFIGPFILAETVRADDDTIAVEGTDGLIYRGRKDYLDFFALLTRLQKIEKRLDEMELRVRRLEFLNKCDCWKCRDCSEGCTDLNSSPTD